MTATFPAISPASALYVIAVICCSDQLPSAIVRGAHESGIECIDVLIYNEEENYSTYLMSGSPEEDQAPLLFIFSQADTVLVDSYQDLIRVEERLATKRPVRQHENRASLIFA